MEETAIIEIDKNVQEERSNIVVGVTDIVVTDKTSCDEALCMGKTINELKKKINEYFDPMVKTAHQAHKAVKTKQNEAIAPLDKAKSIISQKVTAYNQELQQKQREEDERLRRIAEDGAAAEKKRLEALAEAAAEKNDDEEFYKAKMELENVTVDDHTPVSQPKEKVKGMSHNWQIKNIDLPILLKAVIDGKAPMSCIVADEKYIGKRVKMEGDELTIPGVTVHDKGTVRY